MNGSLPAARLAAVAFAACAFGFVASGAETATPLEVDYPKAGVEQFVWTGDWQVQDGRPVSSGKGWEYFHPKAYSALKIISVQADFDIKPEPQGGAAGVRLGTHIGRPQEGWTFMFYPAERKLKFEFRSVNGVKLIREAAADLKAPYSLKLSAGPEDWVFEANGQAIWKLKKAGAPVFYHSGASSLDASMSLRALHVGGGGELLPVIALGDSITHHCQWQRTVSEKSGVPIGNAGMASDDTIGALSRFDTDVLALRPKLVVLFMGTNNKDPDRAAADIDAMASRLRQGGVGVILCTALPREGREKEIARLNESLRKYAAEKGLPLVDWNPLLDGGDGRIKPEYGGPVHPNKAGAELMGGFFLSQPEARKLLDACK